MNRIAVTILSLAIFASIARSQPASDADKFIKQAIDVLKKQGNELKGQKDRDKISKAVAALEMLLTPVKSKVTRENFAQIKNNMTLAEVEEILGPGKETSSDGKLTFMSWRSGDRPGVAISITFRSVALLKDIYVTSKSISD